MSATSAVLKFGGSSFASAADFHTIAAYLADRRSKGKNLVVVVSAPPKLTETWRSMLSDVNPTPSAQTTGGLLPRADTVGAYLLAAAFDRIEVPSRVLPADLLGITTDAVYCNATAQSIDLSRLTATLGAGKIVIVPGGQATGPNGDLTWLGKNSSDVSAILLAAHLQSKHCAIFSDVPGIYSGDPNQIGNAVLFENVGYDDAIAMSLAGAQVLHHRAVGLAREHGIELHCYLNRPPFHRGSIVGAHGTIRAVIPDARSTVLVFPTDSDRHLGLQALEEHNLPVLDLRRTPGRPIVVTCGFSQPEHILETAGIPFEPTGGKLLTILNEGTVDHRICPSVDQLIAAARHSHDRIIASRPGTGRC